MTSTLAGFAVAATPFLAVVALLWIAELIRGRDLARIARQVALTDAVHRELGLAAAPTVRRRLGGGWRVTIALPLDRPHVVAAIVRVIDRGWAELPPAGAAPLEIVLVPRADPRANAPAARCPAPGPVPARAAG